VFALRTDKAAKMMRADLAAAEIPYRDSAGLVADFHSLRHSAGTWLKDAKVHPKVIQTFMRHSTITLTMDRYVPPSITDQTAALEHLPAVGGAQRMRSAQTRQRAS
jgi:integrase